MLESGARSRHAGHGNATARRVVTGIDAFVGIRRMNPLHAKSVFMELPARVSDRSRQRGWAVYGFIGSGAEFMYSWDTCPQEVDDVLADLAADLRL